jgi:hypothetical protein
MRWRRENIMKEVEAEAEAGPGPGPDVLLAEGIRKQYCVEKGIPFSNRRIIAMDS